MRTSVTAWRPRRLRLGGLAAALVMLSVLAGCPGNEDEDQSSLPCDGMADEDMLADVLGAEIERPVGAIEPRHMNSQCYASSLDHPGETYMNIYASYPPATELTDLRSTWPETAAEVRCRDPWRDPWVASGDGQHAYACVRYDETAQDEETVLRSLWGDLEVNVRIARPRARPSDAEDAYRIATDVADRLNAD